MKILFTSVGRRVELVQAFHNAAQELKVELCIIGADITPDAPALLFCDKTRIVCKIREPEYIPQLLSICREEAVDCLIPTIDTDLLILAQNKAKFEAIGTKVLISAVLAFSEKSFEMLSKARSLEVSLVIEPTVFVVLSS